MIVVYGKIILDTVRLQSGELRPFLLGGGGPQSVLGARLCTDSVGFLSRSGTDLDQNHIDGLQGLDADLEGWHQFPSLQTPRISFSYDENQNMLLDGEPVSVLRFGARWTELLSKELTWPPSYSEARCVHLVTEFSTELEVERALNLQRSRGALFSLEPLVDKVSWSNLKEMQDLAPRVDIFCPDLPTALQMAQTSDPGEAAVSLRRLGPRFVAVRAGERGSFVAGEGVEGSVQVPALSLDVVDPTGAGNAFSGALAASLMEGRSLIEAACDATAAAGGLVETLGVPVYSTELADQTRRHSQDLLSGLGC